mmetsp:Transcript_43477/g.77816  ORF Transcript_43477/g.77816 Transcript_43477/m.77816 type:complete len:100 (-) Transcript_43477:450-749(-)|eukprot:CAMPEP_0177770206 /NCGR_PEP_ID=MMETSP0491_2-20121128/10786_1 /TAXON_ID=63592 /ORGANISM="Tetraselmis chuii, Strain PLY429" /LENGTH=99 /DNA_ID=CAMNT_0019287375 /DNA_START=158 /DNA_END=457 /DNA_ORIENTATION=+
MASETVRVSLDSQQGLNSKMSVAVDFSGYSSGESSPMDLATSNRASVDELRCYSPSSASIAPTSATAAPMEFGLCFGASGSSLPVKRTGSCTNLHCWGQ